MEFKLITCTQIDNMPCFISLANYFDGDNFVSGKQNVMKYYYPDWSYFDWNMCADNTCTLIKSVTSPKSDME